jgi:hypothetical protein
MKPTLRFLAALLLPTVLHAADRSQETNPNWQPPATVKPDESWPRRTYLGDKTVQPVSAAQVANSVNPLRVAQQLTERSRQTMPYGLHLFYGDRLPGIGYYALASDPRSPAADSTARALVEQALAGKSLNTDPRSLAYLAKAARALNQPADTRRGEWAFGSERFVRISGTWALAGGVAAGQVTQSSQARLVGTFFNRTRELAVATLASTASASPTGVKSSVLNVRALGRPLLNETLTDKKPLVRRWNVSPGSGIEWWGGSMTVPWLNAGTAFKLNSDPVKVVARTAQGNAVGAGEVAVRARLELLAEMPLVDLFGFRQLVARVNFVPVAGQLIAGEVLGVVWPGGDRPVLRDARHARAELTYGSVNLKITGKSGFGLVPGLPVVGDKTLVNLVKHDGLSTQRDVFSAVRDTPLR